jgi:CheY-like chemotaxis protein
MGSKSKSSPQFLSDILIVDDEDSMRVTLCELLRLKGFSAESARDGYEAVKKISEFRPRLIILDIRMPGMNGVETLRKLKKILPDATYVMMTGYAVQNLRKAALKEGAVKVLEKPFSVVVLIQLIENNLT